MAGVMNGDRMPSLRVMVQLAQSNMLMLMSVALAKSNMSMCRYTDSEDAWPCPALESRERIKKKPSWM